MSTGKFYIVTATFSEEYYADSLDDIEMVKNQIREDYADYNILDISVSDTPVEREIF